MTGGMKAFVVRIWQDDTGQLRGHVSDPLTQERILFRSWRELRLILAASFSPSLEDMIDTDPNQEIHHD